MEGRGTWWEPGVKGKQVLIWDWQEQESSEDRHPENDKWQGSASGVGAKLAPMPPRFHALLGPFKTAVPS